MSATAFQRVRREQARRQDQLRREAEQMAAATRAEREAGDEPAFTSSHKRSVSRPPKVREDDGTDRRN
jgi:hypothetical protein